MTQSLNNKLALRNYPNSNLKPLSEEFQRELESHPSVITIPVQWGQQDANQHLNNVEWMRFAESGRCDYLSMIFLHLTTKQTEEHVNNKKKGLVVKTTEMKYIRPVSYPDALTIATQVKNIEKDQFVFHSKLYSHALNKIAGECKTTCVGYDFQLSERANLDEVILNSIFKLEKNPILAQQLALKLPTRIYSNL